MVTRTRTQCRFTAVALCGGLIFSAGCSSLPATATTTTTSDPTATSAAGDTVKPFDLCSIVTPALVEQVIGAKVTKEQGAVGCIYDGPQGLLVSVSSSTLSAATQTAFDTSVKGTESGAITSLPGLGDGNGAAATHDINTTTYARKGTTVLSIIVFEPPADATAHGQSLMRSALAAL